VRSFEAETGKLLWKFDIKPKAVKRRENRNFFLNSPVFHGGRVYIAGGRDVESGEGPGRLVCLDPSKRGDVSLELEYRPGSGKGNPNSGAVWHFDEIGRALSNVAIHDGLVVAVDFGGFLYCLEAATGRKFWKHGDGRMSGAPHCRRRQDLYCERGRRGLRFHGAGHDHAPSCRRLAAMARPGPFERLARDWSASSWWPTNGPPLVWRATGIGLGIYLSRLHRGRSCFHRGQP
jgi:hypothetical protein